MIKESWSIKLFNIFLLIFNIILLITLSYMGFQLYNLFDHSKRVEESEFQESVCYELTRCDENIVSVKNDIHVSNDGVGFSLVQTVNFDTYSKEVLELEDLFVDSNYEVKVRKLVLSQIENQYPMIKITCPSYVDIINEINLLELSYYFDNTGFVFAFPEGTFSAYAYGNEEVVIPYASVQGIIKDEYIIK